MRTQSNEQPNTYDVSGRELRIRFDIQQVTREGMDGPETSWVAEEVLCHTEDTRNQIIEKIIATKYSVGKELAVINNQFTDLPSHQEYQAFRELAKTLADGYLNPGKQPSTKVPSSISKRQGRQQIISMGLVDAVEVMVSSISDPVQRAMVRSFWDDSSRYEREHPQMIQFAAGLGIAESELDQLFIEASVR